MSTLSPNMNLPIPTVGSEPGPNYASDVNSALTILDAHDHTPGNGVQITPSGLDINSDLSLGSNFATDAAGIVLEAQASTPDVNTIYESGVDLYYVDGNGNNVRITQSGGVAGSPGSISNLTSPASASYVAGTKTFVWESDASIAANLDCAAVLMRNISPNSTYALTLQPPASLAADYTLTLPAVPGSTSIVRLDSSGNFSASLLTDNSTLEISSNTLRVKAQGITASQILNGTITTTQIASATITGSNIAANTITATNAGAPNVTSNTFTQLASLPSTSAIWYTLTNNNVTIGAGTWRLVGAAQFSSGPATVTQSQIGWFGANGGNSGSTPTSLTCTLKGGKIGAVVGLKLAGGSNAANLGLIACESIISVSTTTTVYLNVFGAATGSNVQVDGHLYAEQLSTAT